MKENYTPSNVVKPIAFLFSLLLFMGTNAQTPGSIDLTFAQPVAAIGDSSRLDATANDVAIQSDGKIVVLGSFSNYNGVSRPRILRLNQDGTADNTFISTSLTSGTPSCVALDTTGKIYVGGSISKRIIRLNNDGSVDTSFIVGSGFGDVSKTVKTIVLQTDGKLLVGGSFISYNGTNISRIARLNTDGTIDTTFHTGSGFNADINAVAIQTDGKILVGGNMSQYNGVNAQYLIRLNADGTRDNTFALTGSGIAGYVSSLLVQASGKIVVGGTFTNYNGTSRKGILRLNSDGSLDTGFNTGTGFVGNSVNLITKVYAQPFGAVLIAGDFTSYNGTPVNNVVRLDSTGTVDNTFLHRISLNPGSPHAFATETSGDIIVVGAFQQYDFYRRSNIVRINSSGWVVNGFDIDWGPAVATNMGIDPSVHSITRQPNGKILLGGGFSYYNGYNLISILRIYDNGDLDTSFHSPIIAAGASVDKIVLDTLNSKIYIVGTNLRLSGDLPPYRRLVRLNMDGSVDTTLNTGTGFDTEVRNVKLMPNGQIMVMGRFTTYNGQAVSRLIRINNDGSLDTGFNPGNIGVVTGDAITDLIFLPNGKLLASGNFKDVNLVTVNNIARFDSTGALDPTFLTTCNIPSFTTTGSVNMLQQPDGQILYGFPYSTLFRINTDGVVDGSFNASHSGSDIALQHDGRIIVGGNFIDFNNRTGILRLNSDGSFDSTFNAKNRGFGNTGGISVSALLVLPDGKILAGGNFPSYDSMYITNVVRINGGGCAPAAFNQNLSSVCNDGSTIILTGASPAGGTYSGPGVSSNTFTPSSAGVGIHTLTYSYTDTLGCNSVATAQVNVNAVPSAPTVVGALNILASSAITGNQWYNSSGAISGATGQAYTATANDDYYVIVTDGNGCSSPPSNTFSVVSVGINQIASTNIAIKVQPNPNNGLFTVMYIGAGVELNTTLRVTNVIGEIVYEQPLTNQLTQMAVNTAPGVYFVTISNSTLGNVTKRMVIQ